MQFSNRIVIATALGLSIGTDQDQENLLRFLGYGRRKSYHDCASELKRQFPELIEKAKQELPLLHGLMKMNEEDVATLTKIMGDSRAIIGDGRLKSLCNTQEEFTRFWMGTLFNVSVFEKLQAVWMWLQEFPDEMVEVQSIV